MKFMTPILYFMIIVQNGFACVEDIDKSIINDGRLRYVHGRYVYTDTVINYATIICSNVSSINQITYSYQDHIYNQFLKLTNSNISIIESLAFSQFSTIRTLNLSHVHIEIIQPGAFTGLTNLKELHLDNNELKQVSNGIYNSLHRLEILNLANNRIYQIEKFALMGVANLMELYLENNNLSIIEDYVFNTQERLTYLNLSNNPLEEFSGDGLTSLNTLTIRESSLLQFNVNLSNLTMRLLDLSINQLIAINFSYFPNVHKVDLSRNKIVTAENCEFLNAYYVVLDNNRIKTIDGTFKNVSELYLGYNEFEVLDKSIFSNSRSLLVIDFRFNKISKIETDTFFGLKSLNRLILQNNNITNIDPILFRDLSKLTYLNLSYNRIEKILFGTFDSLINLEILDISNNRLTDLHQYAFNSLAQLSDLYFDNNQIASFDVKDLKNHLPNLHLISLDKNPWNCKDLSKIALALKTVSVTILEGVNYDVENFHGIACINRKDFVKVINVSNESAREFARNFLMTINEGVKNSNMKSFFNEEFKNSAFFQYFNNDYRSSDFFKYLNNYKFTVIKQPSSLNESKVEKLTSLQVVPVEGNNNVLIFSVTIQVVMAIVLFLILYLMFSFLKKLRTNITPNLSSQMELC